MPQTATASTDKIFIIAHNGNNVVHVGVLEPGETVETGQPILEEFASAELMARRAFELKPDVFRTWEQGEENSEFLHGDLVQFNSTLLVRTDNDTTPWAVVDTSV